MTEEIDSIAPIGGAAASDLSGPRVDVRLAPQGARPVRPGAPRAAPPQAQEAPEAPAAGAASEAPSLEESVKRINARLAGVNRVLRLRVDAASGLTIAEIRNSTTGQVLQQIPSSDIVRLAEMLCGWAHGKDALLDLLA